MKLNIKLRAGQRASEHQLELPSLDHLQSDASKVRFLLDRQGGEADWAEVSPRVYSILLNGRSYEVRLRAPPGEAPQEAVRRGAYVVTVGVRDYLVEVRNPRLRQHASESKFLEGPQQIVAPMPGKVVKILVAENQEVGAGDGLLVIEAMKMQNEVRAPRPGRVEKIYVSEDAAIEAGCRLLRLI